MAVLPAASIAKEVETTQVLAPTAELDRLLLATKQALDDSDFIGAANYLQRVQNLKLELPAEFHFYQAKVDMEQGSWRSANQQLTEYVNAAGKEGEHYRAALLALTSIEGRTIAPSAQSSAKPGTQELSWQKKATQPEQQINKLKARYSTGSATKALIQHINILLSEHRYTGTRIINTQAPAGQTPGSSYSITNVDKGTITIQQQLITNDGQTKIESSSISVYGLSRSFKASCEPNHLKCTVKHLETLTPWFDLNFNEQAAQEVAEFTELLVHSLQTQAK